MCTGEPQTPSSHLIAKMYHETVGQNSNLVEHSWVSVTNYCFPRKPCLVIKYSRNVLGDSDSLSSFLLKKAHELPTGICNDICNLLIVTPYLSSSSLFIFFFHLKKQWRPRIQRPFVLPLVSAKWKLYKFWLDTLVIYTFNSHYWIITNHFPRFM